jgi:hypothetical protein
MWFVPPTKSTYGRVYFGFDNLAPQGGMNEKGLFYDGFWVPDEAIKPEDKPVVSDDIYDRVMAECANIDEALQMIKKYKLHYEIQGMLIYGDKNGNAIIIGGGDIVYKENDYLISTNFYPARTSRESIDCWRYLKAEEMLKASQTISCDFIRDILDAVHVRDTQYSIVYDLKKKIFHLYHYHNYKQVRIFDLKEELKKGKKAYDISGLFPGNPEFKKRYQILNKITPNNNWAMKILLLICGIGLLLTPLVLQLLRLKTKLKDNQKSNLALFSSLQTILSLASILALINLLALLKYSNLFIWGFPVSLSGLRLPHNILIHIPWILILLLLGISIILIKAFKKKLWNRLIRFYSLIKTGLVLLIVLIFWYWGFIRWYL